MSAVVRPGGVVCASAAVPERGPGVRFLVEREGRLRPAFAIRHEGRVRAFLNECAHRGVELDWNPGEFFDRFGEALICATHGARYHPASGACLDGPCRGAALARVDLREENGEIRLAG